MVPEEDHPDAEIDIAPIAISIVDSMCAPAVLENGPRDQRKLRGFIADLLHGKIKEELPGWVAAICDECRDEITGIIVAEHHADTMRQVLENARQIRIEKLRAKQERYRTAGEHLNEALNQVRRDAALTECAPSDEDRLIPATSGGPIEGLSIDFTVNLLPEPVAVRYRRELEELLTVAPNARSHISWDDFPISLSLGFIFSSLSRPALKLAYSFLPLPSESTISRRFNPLIAEHEKLLKDIANLESRVDLFIKLSGVKKNAAVSVAVDAMAMSPDRSCLAAKSSDYLFVFYAQPLDRRDKCFPLHIHQGKSGQAKDEVQKLLDRVCAALSARGLNVRYVCSDGDAGYNKRHHEFFKKWYLALLRGGLLAALNAIHTETKMPVSDFLHMWKNFCNKVKNHPVTICPELPDDFITCEDLEVLLGLGGTLSDKSSIGRMRDSYPLQLFSFDNCARCAEEGDHLSLLYLLPWALQEEVIRNPDLTRQERLEKAVLSFHFLVHYFDLSFLPRSDGINQRFRKKDTVAVTFAEDSVWPRILNNALLLIHFIIVAPAD
jgi:hypothetical protein